MLLDAVANSEGGQRLRCHCMKYPTQMFSLLNCILECKNECMHMQKE